jgi:PAS domain S-box-containing protein
MVGAITDVSGRKQAEAQIAYYRAYFATVIKFMPHPIFVKDRERRFITVSHAFCELLGTDEREIIGKVEMGNSTLPAEVGRIIREMDERALAGSGDQIAECTLPLAAGSRRVLIRKTLIADPDGEPLIVGTLTDLTDLRVAERANEAKSEFLANISHELRTPLHSILSFASLGGDRAKGGGQDKLLHYFDRIQQSGGRLLALVNDLLELSKLEAGKMHLTPVPQDILAPIRDIITEVETLAAERQIRIDIADCCTDTVVAIDGTRFPQVMRNVLSNAIKYSPPERTVRIFLTDSRLSRGRRATDLPEIPALEIEVRDEGIGIPEDELDTIFDKFVQSSRTNTGAGGTGLGLAISREIVLAHRGHIRARNNPGGGASFFVTLPRAVQPGH